MSNLQHECQRWHEQPVCVTCCRSSREQTVGTDGAGGRKQGKRSGREHGQGAESKEAAHAGSTKEGAESEVPDGVKDGDQSGTWGWFKDNGTPGKKGCPHCFSPMEPATEIAPGFECGIQPLKWGVWI